MFDYEALSEAVTAIHELHKEEMGDIFEAVYMAENEDDFEKIQGILRELLDGFSASYSAVGGLIRWTDQREVEAQQAFITSVRSDLDDLPLYNPPREATKLVRSTCTACFGRKTAPSGGTCPTCSGAGKILVPHAGA